MEYFLIMTTELWITIGIAIIGWGWAIIQVIYKRKWQKKDALVSRRYDAYFQYMRKCEEISENMRKDPQAIYNVAQEFVTKILNGNNEESNDAIIEFNQQLLDYLKCSCSLLTIINQELNSLRIIASKELLEKVVEQKNLIIDFSNEMQNCLNKINIKDSNTFRILNTIGQENRWSRLSSLNNEIITVMRKEMGIE